MKNSPKGEIPWDLYFDFYQADAITGSGENWVDYSSMLTKSQYTSSATMRMETNGRIVELSFGISAIVPTSIVILYNIILPPATITITTSNNKSLVATVSGNLMNSQSTKLAVGSYTLYYQAQ